MHVRHRHGRAGHGAAGTAPKLQPNDRYISCCRHGLADDVRATHAGRLACVSGLKQWGSMPYSIECWIQLSCYGGCVWKHTYTFQAGSNTIVLASSATCTASNLWLNRTEKNWYLHSGTALNSKTTFATLKGSKHCTVCNLCHTAKLAKF